MQRWTITNRNLKYGDVLVMIVFHDLSLITLALVAVKNDVDFVAALNDVICRDDRALLRVRCQNEARARLRAGRRLHEDVN